MPWGMMPSGHRVEGRTGLAVTSTTRRRGHQKLCISSSTSIQCVFPALVLDFSRIPPGLGEPGRGQQWCQGDLRSGPCAGRELGAPWPGRLCSCVRAPSRPVRGVELPQEVPREGEAPTGPGPCLVVPRLPGRALCHGLSGCLAWPLCASVLSPEEQKAHLG